jgi:trigger factor
MSVVLAIEEIGPCRKQLKIEVPAPAVEAETSRVTGEYAKKARLPGFRKGKVPEALVRRHFGDEIRRELIDRLIPRYWRQAAAEKGIDPLGAPAVEEIDLRDGAPLTFTAVVEVRPEIELRNYRDFALPEPAAEPSTDEVARALEDLRRSHATWVVVERPAAVGDRVKVDVQELDAEPPAEPQSAEIEVGSPRVWEELSLAVTGLAAGQTGRFGRRTGEGEGERERAFEVRVGEVQGAELPELDLEFVRHFGEFDSVEAFRADVAHRLLHAKEDDARQERERAMLDQLTERHPFELPAGVVRSEVEALLREYAESLVRRGVDLEQAQIDWQRVGEEAQPHAERRVRARLLLDAIAEREGIEVSEPEFEQALAVLARLQGVASGALRQRLDAAEELGPMRARMRRDKTVRYLLGESGEHAHGHAHAEADPGARPGGG